MNQSSFKVRLVRRVLQCFKAMRENPTSIFVLYSSNIPGLSCHILHHCLFYVYLFSCYLLRLRLNSSVRSCCFFLRICCDHWLSIHMNEVSSFQTEPTQKYQNMHSNISPVGNTSNGCKKTKNDCPSIQKGALLRPLVATRE